MSYSEQIKRREMHIMKVQIRDIASKIEEANKGDFERKLLMLDSIYCNLEKALQIIHKGE
jgi:hypothetical protein